MDREAAEIKNIIKSLLISNPMRSTIGQLAKDFIEMEGRTIPYQRLGFFSLEEYLLSIPDIVTIHGRGACAELEVVVSSKSEHINEMVLKQKKKVPHPKRPPRRYPPRPPIHYPPKHGFAPTRRYPHYNTYNSNIIFSAGSFQAASFSLEGNVRYFNTKFTDKASTSSSETNDNSYLCVDRNSLTSDTPESHYTNSSEDPVYIETKCESPVAQEDVLPPTAETQEDPKSDLSKNDEISLDECCSTRVPSKVRENLRALIQEFADGIECSRIPEEYKRMFKKNIRYDDYSYRSLIEMCSDLPEIFHFYQYSSDDYILYDSSKPLPTNCKPKYNTLEKKHVQVETVATTHILDEIPNLNWSTAAPLIPPDVLRITDEITRFFPVVAVGDLLDITVGEIYDLSKFWVYMTYGGLDTLMTNLQDFFSKNGSEYVLPQVLVEEGLYCVSLFAGQYHRCVIVKLLQHVKGFARVLYVDYGTVDNVPTTQLWFLPKQFGDLPSQAIRARLSNIYPVYENRPWCNDAVVRFERSVTNRVVVGEVTKVDEQDHILELYLADITKKTNIFYINDVMVTEGYALYADQERKPSLVDYDCMATVRYIHLYPQFFEIESGMAPITEEMRYIVANKIPLHHYMPQYFDIYFFEDIDAIEKQHELLFKKMPEISIPPSIEYEFDLSFFGDSDVDEFKRLYEEENCDENPDHVQTEASCGGTNSSFENYFCNKKRLSDIRQGKVLKCDKSDFSLNYSDTCSIESASSVTHDRSVVSLNNSLKRLDLNSDLNATSDFIALRTCTNPFLSDEYLNTTNPFRTTNPFVTDLELTVNRSELLDIFAKPSDGKLPEKIVNNLSDARAHSCKEKNTNVERSGLLNNSGVSDSGNATNNVAVTNTIVPNNHVRIPENNETTLSAEIPRIRTPPGFSSRNRQNRMPNENLNCNFMPTSFGNNPYYQQFPNSQINNTPFLQQNYMNMSLPRPYIDPGLNFLSPVYLNQYRFNSPDWRQSFQQPPNVNFPGSSMYGHFFNL